MVEQLLNARIRIRTPEDRIIVGNLVCLDKQGNIVLHNAEEEYLGGAAGEARFLGSVVVPARQRCACDVIVTSEKKENEMRSLVSQCIQHQE